MAEHTSLATKFYTDPYIQTLPPTDKLLFLYLIAGPQTEATLGIFELSLFTMAFHTGLEKDNIEHTLNRFAEAGKIHHVDGWVVLKNHFKNNPLRGNERLIKAAMTRFDKVPWTVKDRVVDPTDTLYIPYLDPNNDLCITLLPVPSLPLLPNTRPIPVPAGIGGADDKSSKGKWDMRAKVEEIAKRKEMGK
jgi:hypothetical protein